MVVVAAVGDSGESALVEEAARIAKAFDVPLHLVSVADQPSGTEDIGASTDDDHLRERLRDIAAQRASEAASAVVEDAEIVGLIGEKPANEVLEYARDCDAIYIVVGGRKRSPVGKALFGSVTQSILLNADCPVVTVMTPE